MELNVAQLISATAPPKSIVLERLHSAFSEIRTNDLLLDYDLTKDQRFEKKEWQVVLQNEILKLYDWTLRRLIYSHNSIPSGRLVLKSVYCLQPRYGITLHLFRRVFPFSILSLKTNCIFRPDIQAQASEIVDYFSAYFKLDTINVLSKQDVLHIPDRKSNLIMVTGMESTFEIIASRFTHAKVIGSLGTCSIVIAKNRKQAANFLKKDHIQLKESCTAVSSVILVEDSKKSKRYYDSVIGQSYSLEQILRKYNPTIIYDIANHFSRRNLRELRYCTTQRAMKGENGFRSPVGMCADPIHGYPGDYCI